MPPPEMEAKEEVKYAFRNLGPKEEKEADTQAEDSKLPHPQFQQSVYQSPVDSTEHEIPLEVRVIAEEARMARRGNSFKWYLMRIKHCVGAALVLGIASYMLAYYATKNPAYPYIACVLGSITGFGIGFFRIDYIWAKIIHTIPQIIWGCVALYFDMQEIGFASMMVVGVWLAHIYLSSMVAMKIQLDSRMT